MTYAELVAAIEAYTQNDESTFVANIPNFVRSAELQIARSVALPSVLSGGTIALASGDTSLTIPATIMYLDYLRVRPAAGTTYTYLLPKERSFLTEAFPNTATTGAPIYYALDVATTFTSTIYIAPKTDGAYSAEYYGALVNHSVVGAGGTETWLSINGEDVLLYGALIEANIFMKGEADVMTMYVERYKAGLERLKVMCEGFRGTDNYRSGRVMTGRN